MKAMNPMSPDAARQQLEEERFLKGEAPAPATSSAPHGH
jgi:hypothetical protein